MARQAINLGTAPTGAGGDTTRSTAVKINAMTDELYNKLLVASIGVTDSAAYNGNSLNPDTFRTGGLSYFGQFLILGVASTGFLTVQPGSDASWAAQQFINANTGVVYTRSQNSASGWLPWQGTGTAARLTAGSAAGNVMLVGDRASPLVNNINTYGNSFQIWNSTGTTGAPEAGSFGTIINSAWPGGTYGTQIFMSVTGRMWFRAGDYASAPMREVYHTGNTTRAADGTLKAI